MENHELNLLLSYVWLEGGFSHGSGDAVVQFTGWGKKRSLLMIKMAEIMASGCYWEHSASASRLEGL